MNSKPKQVLSLLVALVLTLSLLAEIPLTAFANQSPVYGSSLVELPNGNLLLTIKGPEPIQVANGTTINIIAPYNFAGCGITTTAPLTTTGFNMSSCEMRVTSAFTIPTGGIAITITNVGAHMPYSMQEAWLSIMDSQPEVSDETIPYRRPGQGDIKDSTLTAPGASIYAPATFTLTLIPDEQFVTPVAYFDTSMMMDFPGTDVLISALGADFTNATLPAGYTIINAGADEFEFSIDTARTVPLTGFAIPIGNVVPYLTVVSDIKIQLDVPWGFTPSAAPPDIAVAFSNFNISASTLAVPANTAMYTLADMTLTLRGTIPFDLAAGDYLLLGTQNGVDFSDAFITAPGFALSEFTGGRMRISLTSNLSVPLSGVPIVIRNVMMTRERITPRLEMYVSLVGDTPLADVTADQVELEITMGQTAFSPNYLGVIPSTTVTVAAKNKTTGAVAAVNGEVNLAFTNGHITLINNALSLNGNMTDGALTFTMNNLQDGAGLSQPYTVDLTASAPGKNIEPGSIPGVVITPNPLSVSGIAKDENGSPVEGATVWLETPDGYIASRVTTGSDGRFTLYSTARSSAYSLIGVKDEMIDEATVELFPGPVTQDLTLYTMVKVTVNFYRNKATLDGTPNTNIFSAANLYTWNNYSIEAYSDPQGRIPVKIDKRDGYEIHVRRQEIMAGGGELFVKATPYSVNRDPFTDNSSELYEVTDFPTQTINTAERPVGSITVRNTSSKALTISFFPEDVTQTNANATKVVTIVAGGVYSYVPPEGYGGADKTIVVKAPLSERIALVRMGRSADITFTENDVGGYNVAWEIISNELPNGNVELTFRPGNVDGLSIDFDNTLGGFNVSWQMIGNTIRLQLSEGLELAPNWRDTFSATTCSAAVRLTSSDMVLTQEANGFTFRVPFFNAYHWSPDNSHSLGLKLNEKYGNYQYYGANVFNWKIHVTVRAKDGGAAYQAHSVQFSRPLRNEVYVSHIVYRPFPLWDIPYYSVVENIPYEWRSFIQTTSFTTGKPLSIEGPFSTSGNSAFVQGNAGPNRQVTIRVDGYPDSTIQVNSNSAGRYSANVTLPETDRAQDFTITASTGGQSVSCKVRSKISAVYARELWLGTSLAGTGGFSKEYLVMNKSLSGGVLVDSCAGQVQNITLGTSIKFRVRVSDNDMVQKVFVSTGSAGLHNIPCVRNGAYWESEELTNVAWGGNFKISDFTVTVVPKIGSEYMSEAALLAGMNETAAAAAAYSPPADFFTDRDAFMDAAERTVFDALPPELRAAEYTTNPDGSTHVKFPANDGTGRFIEFDVEVERLEDEEFEEFALEAQSSPSFMAMGSGGFYVRTRYICTLTGGGTRTYTADEFEEAMYQQSLRFPNDSPRQLLSRLGISGYKTESTEYAALVQNTRSRATFGDYYEAFRKTVEYTANTLDTFANSPVAKFTPLNSTLKMSASFAGVAASVLGIPSRIIQGQDARDVANAYDGMLRNARDMKHTECYGKLSAAQKSQYDSFVNRMELDNHGMKSFKRRQLAASIGMNFLTVANAAISVIPTGGGGAAGKGISKGAKFASGLVGLGANVSMDVYFDGKLKDDYNKYRAMYNEAQNWNNLFMQDAALACGEKEEFKSEGVNQIIYDPSGVAYDGTLDRPLEGVRAELWTADDEYGTNARYWAEAEDYDQINPQITDETGYYSWFTPEGFWQVRVSKAGYADRRSEWLEVLPPHYGVHLNMGSEPYTVTYHWDEDDPGTNCLVARGSDHTILADMGFDMEDAPTLRVIDLHSWNTEPDGSGTAYQPGDVLQKVQADMTLYAQYSFIVYKVTFDLAGGTRDGGGELIQASLPGGAVEAPTATRSGYTFSGWDKDFSFITSDMTVTAKWTAAGTGGPPAQPPGGPVTDPKPPLSWFNPYNDVVESDWFYDAVRFVTERGLMNGTAADRFSPGVTTTRAMIVTVLHRLEGKPTVTGGIPFSDVKAGQWYSDAILWASQNDIVLGYGNGKFGPDDPITREQAVAILYRYAKFKGIDVGASADLSGFVDASAVSDWALDAMKWAVAVGIIEGRPGNRTAPRDTSTRAELAMIFKRYVEDFLDDGVDEDE